MKSLIKKPTALGFFVTATAAAVVAIASGIMGNIIAKRLTSRATPKWCTGQYVDMMGKQGKRFIECPPGFADYLKGNYITNINGIINSLCVAITSVEITAMLTWAKEAVQGSVQDGIESMAKRIEVSPWQNGNSIAEGLRYVKEAFKW